MKFRVEIDGRLFEVDGLNVQSKDDALRGAWALYRIAQRTDRKKPDRGRMSFDRNAIVTAL